MKRLQRLARSRRTYKEIELMTVNGNNNRSLIQQADMHFILAKRIIADLPLTPTNDLMYKIVDDMMEGKYADLGSLDTADTCWDRWLNRTKSLLQNNGRWANLPTKIIKSILTVR